MSGQPMPGGLDPAQNVSGTIIDVTAVFTALTVLCLVFRLTSRTITGLGMALDDYLSVCATVFLIGIQVCVGIMTPNGIGHHVTWLAEHPESATTLGKTTLAFSLIYPTCQFFAKTSALALLTRIFTLNDPLLRIGSYFLWVYSTLVFCASIIVTFLQCRPISTNWGVPSTCSPPAAASLALNILIATTDLFLIILPQPSIWRLKLNFGKKLGLSLIFMIGLLALIVAIVRMVIVHKYQSSMDLTYNESNAIIFTIVEPACVIICGCLPTVPKCFQQIKKWNGWSRLSSLVSSRTGTGVSQSTTGANDNSIVATKSWNVLRSDNSAVKGFVSRDGSFKSTDRLELGQVQGGSRTYVGYAQA